MLQLSLSMIRDFVLPGACWCYQVHFAVVTESKQCITMQKCVECEYILPRGQNKQ